MFDFVLDEVMKHTTAELARSLFRSYLALVAIGVSFLLGLYFIFILHNKCRGRHVSSKH